MKDKATPKRPFKELQSDQAIGLQSKSMKVANKITQERVKKLFFEIIVTIITIAIFDSSSSWTIAAEMFLN